MRNKIILILLAIVAILVLAVAILIKRVCSLSTDRDNYAATAKAYAQEREEYNGSSRVFRMTIDELEASRDTLMMKLDSLRTEAKIKNRQLKSMHWRETIVEKTDTIWLKDSIFLADLDTTLSDGWTMTNVHIARPDKVGVSVKVRNETTLIVRSRKETVKPPKRFFLFRLFQRKHTIVEVEAIEGNPHCIERSRRHVEIID